MSTKYFDHTLKWFFIQTYCLRKLILVAIKLNLLEIYIPINTRNPINEFILEIIHCYRIGKLMNPKCKQSFISKGYESIVVLVECCSLIMQ